MRRNLHQPPNGDIVQGTLTFEAGEHPFHRLPLLVDSLPLSCLRGFVFRGQFLAVHRVNLDDGSRPKLPLDELVQGSARVPGISNNVLGMELAASVSGLGQNIGCPGAVVGVSRADAGSDRNLIFAVHGQMELVTQYELGFAVGILLDRPSGLRIRSFTLTTVDPSLQGSAVQGYPLSKSRKLLVTPLG